MKVLDLRCAHGHRFEGWFACDEDFMEQNGRALVACPMCADTTVARMPSAPRLNLSGAHEAEPARTSVMPQPSDLQAAWLKAARELMSRTEDVGERFAEEARRIHYGESQQRGIRGQASDEQRESLREEGIETFALPVPRGLDGPLQ
ncbi:MAG TPA: DUF1178 family protein [Rubrivivax sp.]|jgi:hypothetical protein|nr:DUF1178 family protein [Pseudomonadota bacterium]HOL38286.1 DUF1178 family protein [Rubrivivax sp.]HPP83973.1 DUF1178 family protein [Rubrivivax sp.]